MLTCCAQHSLQLVHVRSLLNVLFRSGWKGARQPKIRCMHVRHIKKRKCFINPNFDHRFITFLSLRQLSGAVINGGVARMRLKSVAKVSVRVSTWLNFKAQYA